MRVACLETSLGLKLISCMHLYMCLELPNVVYPTEQLRFAFLGFFLCIPAFALLDILYICMYIRFRVLAKRFSSL